VKGFYDAIAENTQIQKVMQRILSVHPHLKAFALDPDAEIIRIRIQSFLMLCGVDDAHFIEL
jgi:hypothetical protein